MNSLVDGGEEYDDVKFWEGQQRADLCEMINKLSFPHGMKITDAILARYTLILKDGHYG